LLLSFKNGIFEALNIFQLANYLDSLNPAQKQAVMQKDGPMIIIAGAGSGKTRVLTYRMHSISYH
jgi:superfamily I DNA and RNA helicase